MKNQTEDVCISDFQEEGLSSREMLSQLTFCVMDLETTGGDHQYDKIIEIGLVKIKNLQIVDEISFLLNPKIHIPEFVQKLTSIYQDQLTDAPVIKQIIGQVINFIGPSSILVAHNASFDIPFLNSELQRLSMPQLNNQALCTNLMTRYLIPEIMNSNLSYVGELFGITHKRAHRALEDAKVTAKVLLYYLNFFVDRNIKKINHIYYPRKKYELDMVNFSKDEDSKEEILSRIKKSKVPLLITFKGKKGAVLSAMPIAPHTRNNHLPMLTEILNGRDWQTVSLKMIGNYFKSILLLQNCYHYLNKNAQEQLINLLSADLTLDLNMSSSLTFDDSELETYWEKSIANNFLIAPHLIRGHYIIFALSNLFQGKSELVFRYPTHQKRLIQFINYHCKQLRVMKKSRSPKQIPLWMKPLLVLFLKNLNNHQEKYFSFSANNYTMENKKIVSQLSSYLGQKNHLINYPLEYI